MSDVNWLWISRQLYEKYLDTKFDENPSSGSRVVLCGQLSNQTGKYIRDYEQLQIYGTNPFRCSLTFNP